MIELVIGDRCIDCDRCVKVCPTNVFDTVPGGHPVIARQQDCQTCFMCELYCPADALYVGPDCDQPEPVTEDDITKTDWPQQYRRDSGWGKDRVNHPNETWYMQHMLPEIIEIRAKLTDQRPENRATPQVNEKLDATGDSTRPSAGEPRESSRRAQRRPVND